jgi:hypothetical protein
MIATDSKISRILSRVRKEAVAFSKCLLPFRYKSSVFSSIVQKHTKIRVCKNIISHVVQYRWETWSVTLGEEHGLGVSQKTFMGLFGQKNDEMRGGWRNLHSENLYSSQSIIRMIK